MRVITSKGDKSFAGNVAVNLNNQTVVEPSFLRSNDPHVMQLASSLASIGWYLERREGEVKDLTEEEIKSIEMKIGRPLTEAKIALKEGAQAYTATFGGLPEIAKKDPKKIFAGTFEGGYFEEMFSEDLSAEKFVQAYQIYQYSLKFVKNFGLLKKRKAKAINWKADYSTLLGWPVTDEFLDEVDQVIPQSTVFLAALIFHYHINIQGKAPALLITELQDRGDALASEMIYYIMKFTRDNPSNRTKSWPTLMKSQAFFSAVSGFVGSL